MKVSLGCLVAGLAPLAMAHDGDGTGISHWHASDTWGFVVLGLVMAAALWASRRKGWR